MNIVKASERSVNWFSSPSTLLRICDIIAPEMEKEITPHEAAYKIWEILKLPRKKISLSLRTRADVWIEDAIARRTIAKAQKALEENISRKSWG